MFTSCATWVAPSYTSVDKMLRVEKGMTPEQVDETLGVKPYNMLHRNDSTALFEYHYRIKDRDINNISDPNEFMHTEESQKVGEPWYTNPSKFYVLFEQDRFATLITETGLKNSDYLLLRNNNLFLVSQSDLVDLDLWKNAAYLHKTDKTSRSPKTRLAKSYTPKRIKHYILYSAYIPYGAIGLKYAVGGKVGGYVSAAYSFDYKFQKITYITGGLFLKISPEMNVYLGGGLGPYKWEYHYSHYEYIALDAFVLEAGTLLNFKSITFDLGIGYNFGMTVYGKLGIGVNF